MTYEDALQRAQFDALMAANDLVTATCNYDQEDDVEGPEPCSGVARWSFRCEKCHLLWVYCHKHRRGLDRYIAETAVMMAPNGHSYVVKCVECSEQLPVPIPWMAL